MPYIIRKVGRKYKVVNKRTKRVIGTHATKDKAEKQINLLHAIDHGWKPKKQ